MQQLLSLMISIVMFFLSLFGFNPGTTAPETPADDTAFRPVYLSDRLCGGEYQLPLSRQGRIAVG